MLDDLWDKFWRDDRGHVVIYQTPNAWLIAWAVLDFASLFFNGVLSSVLWYLGSASIIIWALFEIFQGVNYFRRTLGAVVLLLAIASIFSLGL
ncbi:MAG TPA: hypothetical protein VG604_01915 [Candidatus Saccharimonadales bacterium]|nr:hypothetical protein [Candidatus Saccharimonadales bacterium]